MRTRLNFGRTGKSSRASLRYMSFLLQLAFHLLQFQLSSSLLAGTGITHSGSRQYYMATRMEGFGMARSAFTRTRFHRLVIRIGTTTGSSKPHTPRCFGNIFQLRMLPLVRATSTAGGYLKMNKGFPFLRSAGYRLSGSRSPSFTPGMATARDSWRIRWINEATRGCKKCMYPTQRWSSSSSADASPKLEAHLHESKEADSYSGYEYWVRRLYQTNMFNPVKLGLTNIVRIHELLGSPMDDVSH